MSEVKVNKISPRTNCGTTTLGDSGDTFNIPSGSKINVASGGNITVACGATITNNGTQTGFGREGSVNWQTGSIKTGTFTAVDGEGYFINTSGGTSTVNLPAGSAGAIVAVADYTRTFNDNNCLIAANGSEKIGGIADDATLSVNGQAATFVYVDATEGWINVQNAEDTETGTSPFIVASGGTESTCGDYRIHKFTGPGTLSVTAVSPVAANNLVSYLVVAAGGGGGTGCAGGAGGGGGFREYRSPGSGCYSVSPLNGNPGGTSVTISATPYPITVGSGGAAGPGPASPGATGGAVGGPSIFSSVTSTGGGGGAGGSSDGDNGGSGGGAAHCNGTSGSGNTPPVSPAQGQDGGGPTTPSPQTADDGGGGGGGAIEAGNTDHAGYGGDGTSTSITGASVAYAGGGGAGMRNVPGGQSCVPTAGGDGGGGPGGGTNTPYPRPAAAGTGGNGTDNTGGGGGGGSRHGPGGGNTSPGGTGGSGVVIIRYKYQ